MVPGQIRRRHLEYLTCSYVARSKQNPCVCTSLAIPEDLRLGVRLD